MLEQEPDEHRSVWEQRIINLRVSKVHVSTPAPYDPVLAFNVREVPRKRLCRNVFATDTLDDVEIEISQRCSQPHSV